MFTYWEDVYAHFFTLDNDVTFGESNHPPDLMTRHFFGF